MNRQWVWTNGFYDVLFKLGISVVFCLIPRNSWVFLLLSLLFQMPPYFLVSTSSWYGRTRTTHEEFTMFLDTKVGTEWCSLNVNEFLIYFTEKLYEQEPKPKVTSNKLITVKFTTLWRLSRCPSVANLGVCLLIPSFEFSEQFKGASLKHFIQKYVICKAQWGRR